MKEIEEASGRAFDMSSKNLQLEHKIFIDNSVKDTSQLQYDVCLFDDIHYKVEIFESNNTLTEDEEII